MVRLWCSPITLVLWIVFQTGKFWPAKLFLNWKYDYYSLVSSSLSVTRSHALGLVPLSFTSKMAATYEAEARHSLASQRSLSNVQKRLNNNAKQS